MAARSWNVAIVGALGMVGSEMIRTLERRNFPVAELRPLDLPANEGREIEFRDQKVRTRAAMEQNFRGIDIALFSAGATASLDLAPKAVGQGAVVVDNSSAWRMDPNCPLVVPEVNARDLDRHKGIIANPNCSTIQMVVVLKPIHDRARIRRVVVSTYQATTGAGNKGSLALERESMQFCRDGTAVEPQGFQYQIAFNVIPHIDVFQEGGYTKEEYKMANETKKIMGDDSIRLTATCVRVPVFYGHSEAVNIETETKISPEEARGLLEESPSVIVLDDPQNLKYPMPIMTDQQDATYVGRIREDFSIDNGLNLWIVANNIRKGAALNAVQIAEELVRRNLLASTGA
ncbi:MAG: aspartate-semialdehyde dehydrogenase [Spirochaetaceae bacterium]|nr:MAG: aspartate-semialdehyde dehydrogenase [Spirochaetaceae bacterium]